MKSLMKSLPVPPGSGPLMKSLKRPAAALACPIWCKKSCQLYPDAVSDSLGISEKDCRDIFSQCPEGESSEGGLAIVNVAVACADAMATALKEAVQRNRAAFEAAEEAAFAASVNAGDHGIVNKDCQVVARAAAACVKAEREAYMAAAEVRRSLDKQMQAAASAEAADRKYRKCRDRLQRDVAAQESMAIRFAHTEPVTLSNGIKAFDDPQFVGDIDRFFIKMFVAGIPGGYMLCLPDAINDRDTIASIKTKIQAKEGMPADRIKLIWKGEKLSNERTLSSYGIVDNDVDWQIYGAFIPETLPLPENFSEAD